LNLFNLLTGSVYAKANMNIIEKIISNCINSNWRWFTHSIDAKSAIIPPNWFKKIKYSTIQWNVCKVALLFRNNTTNCFSDFMFVWKSPWKLSVLEVKYNPISLVFKANPSFSPSPTKPTKSLFPIFSHFF